MTLVHRETPGASGRMSGLVIYSFNGKPQASLSDFASAFGSPLNDDVQDAIKSPNHDRDTVPQSTTTKPPTKKHCRKVIPAVLQSSTD
jgi:hypothetical protein